MQYFTLCWKHIFVLLLQHIALLAQEQFHKLIDVAGSVHIDLVLFSHQKDKLFYLFKSGTGRAWGVLMDTFIRSFVNSPRTHSDNQLCVHSVSPASWALKTDQTEGHDNIPQVLSLIFCWLDTLCCLQRRLRQVGLLTGPEITFVKFVVAFCFFRWFLFYYHPKQESAI